MKSKLHQLSVALCLLVLSTILYPLSTASAQGTAFTYQGRLNNGTNPANGSYDFRFRLASDALGNNYVGVPVLTNGLPVSGGLFTVTLDFGGVFTGNNYWLEIDVRTNGAGGYTVLAPLQSFTSTPYAVMANSASNLLGNLPPSQFSGTYGSAVTLNNAANSFTGNGAGLTALNASQLSSGTVADARLSGNVALRAGGNAFTGNQTVMGGSVGIGTTTPGNTLDVNGGINATGGGYYDATKGPNWSDIYYGSTGDWYIRSATNTGKVVIQDTGGNVGIGINTPQEKLHINGNLLVSSNITAGNITASNILLPGTVVNGMAYIPAGSFTMGDALDGTANAPLTNVYVSAFFMDVNLVTLSQWETIRLWAYNNAGYVFAAGSGKGPNHPVQTVTWYDVVKWCNARSQQAGLTPVYYTDAGFTTVYVSGNVDAVYANWSANGYRLPTEAEWEKAARGGLSGKRFPWGNYISENVANYNGNTASYSYDLGPNGYNAVGSVGGTSPATSPVGSFAANGYGLYDMAGNVWEWCWDWYGTYAGGNDPHGPASGSIRVQRGGCWNVSANYSQCAFRNYFNGPSSNYIYIGFRCVRGL